MGLQRLSRCHIVGNNLRAQWCEGDIGGLVAHPLSPPPHKGQASVDHVLLATQTVVEKAGINVLWMRLHTLSASPWLLLQSQVSPGLLHPGPAYGMVCSRGPMEGGATVCPTYHHSVCTNHHSPVPSLPQPSCHLHSLASCCLLHIPAGSGEWHSCWANTAHHLQG